MPIVSSEGLPDAVASLRERLWDGGYRPIAVRTRDKRPLTADWHAQALEDPPRCLGTPVSPGALNTGILGDGLRPIDGDIDNADVARQVRDLAFAMLGEAPLRLRQNSSRFLLLYRAAEGAPKKTTLAGTLGKIEVLGQGQQFVAYGDHPSGARIYWPLETPETVPVDRLTAVTEAQVEAFLAAASKVIGAETAPLTNGADRAPGEPQADTLRVAAALRDINNDGPADWEAWNRIGMAVWAATGGGEMGWAAFDAWSARNAAYDAALTRARWEHYRTSPPTRIGAGTLFRMARPAGAKAKPLPVNEAKGRLESPVVEEGFRARRVRTGDAFVGAFVPPDWLIDGILERGRLYACTSSTGHGKTAVWCYIACMMQAGRPVGALETARGNVLYWAGENHVDVQARMLGMCHAYKIPSLDLPFVLSETFPLTLEARSAIIDDILLIGGPLDLVVIDTAAAYFPGDDENDNVAVGTYGRTLRSLTELPGRPAVVVLSHPVKRAAATDLLPRGGGAFLNELDANLTLWSADHEVTQLHWQGKLRGPDFTPLEFRFQPAITGHLDRKGRDYMTVVAEPLTEREVADHTQDRAANENTVLRALNNQPGISHSDIARQLGWVDRGGAPLRYRVQRCVATLAEDKLVEQRRKGGKWTVTSKGRHELGVENAPE